MIDHKNRKVFISYSQKDAVYADHVKNVLVAQDLEVWMDSRVMGPGDHISTEILEGLKDSAYYLLLISENSNSSPWVQREISVAFERARNDNIAIVPFLLEKVDVPLEFRGLVYIDGTKSFKDGLESLIEFFKRQTAKMSTLAPPEVIQKSFDQKSQQRRHCQLALRNQELGDLRHVLSEKLTLKDIRIIWFDVFNTKMEDDVFSQDKATCCLELLDRSFRDALIEKLIDKVCRNHPAISSAF